MTSGTKYSIWLESRHKVIVSWINRASSLNPKSSDFGCAWLGGNIPTQSPEKLVTASGQTSSIHRELAYKYPSPSLSLSNLSRLFFFFYVPTPPPFSLNTWAMTNKEFLSCLLIQRCQIEFFTLQMTFLSFRFHWNKLPRKRQRLPGSFVSKRSDLRRWRQFVHVPVSSVFHRPLLQSGRGRVRVEAERLQERRHVHQHPRRILVHLRQRMDGI